MRVSRSGLQLEDTFLDSQDRHIEGTASQIEDQHVLLTHRCRLLVQTVSNSSGSWLVDNTQHIQPGNHSNVLRSLPLRVIEIGWHRHHSVLDGRPEVCLRDLLLLQPLEHLLQQPFPLQQE
jgi:hypothetical protein